MQNILPSSEESTGKERDRLGKEAETVVEGLWGCKDAVTLLKRSTVSTLHTLRLAGRKEGIVGARETACRCLSCLHKDLSLTSRPGVSQILPFIALEAQALLGVARVSPEHHWPEGH